jgi:hypothetical protein
MLDLLKDLAVIGVIIILNSWFYAVEDTLAYDFVVGFLDNNKSVFLAVGIFGSATLVLFSAMFEGLGIYKLTYGISRISVRVCQFLITFLCVLNIAFYFAVDANLMRDNGYIVFFAIVLIIVSGCWSLRMIDFNHPTKDILTPVGIFAFLSIMLVEFIWPMFF